MSTGRTGVVSTDLEGFLSTTSEGDPVPIGGGGGSSDGSWVVLVGGLNSAELWCPSEPLSFKEVGMNHVPKKSTQNKENAVMASTRLCEMLGYVVSMRDFAMEEFRVQC